MKLSFLVLIVCIATLVVLFWHANRPGEKERGRVFKSVEHPSASSALSGASYLKRAGPVIHYRFDQTSGTNILDLTDKANNGNIKGAALWQADAFVFDGKNSIEISSPAKTAFGRGGFTVELVMATDALPTEASRIVYAGYPGGNDWQIFMHPNGILWFSSRTEGGNFIGVKSKPVPLKEFVHLVGTRDQEGIVNLYINGELQDTESGANADYNVDAEYISLGKARINVTWSFIGRIKEFRLYPRTVGEDEDEVIKHGLEYRKAVEQNFWGDTESKPSK
ncbi:MAG: LamG domain-containing protein [Kiritimatiellaeota bacterium]|nr:LamG domain-containing protein [Kiritimatiellota bacterium]